MQDSTLPAPIAEAIAPLLEQWPPSRAMAQLVVREEAPKMATGLVMQMLDRPELAGRPELAAGLWLYVDDLDRSHRLSQGMDSSTGSYWHAIMHRREGDFSNSLYWLRRTGRHPAMQRVGQDYDPEDLVRAVERAAAPGGDPAEQEKLVDLQRREWWTLFAWCASEGEAG